jgi:hypothetical protein
MEAAVPEDHVLVRIAREIHRDCQAGARSGDLRLLVTSPEFKALPQFQQDVAHTVCGLEERLEWISELLKIVVEKLADVDYLIRICKY